MELKKRYFYKIYDSDGNYIKTQNDVIDEQPVFVSELNGGVGSLRVRYARSWTDYYDSDDLNLYYELRIFVSDKEDNSKRIYSGYLNAINLRKDRQGHEFVECEYLGYVSEFELRVLEFSSGETGLYYTSDEPGEILEDVIDKYNGKVSYTASSIEDTGNVTTELFNLNTVREALEVVLERSPIGWYWKVDADNIIHLKSTNLENIDHYLLIGKHINRITARQTMENVRNDIRVVGGTPDGEQQIYKKYQLQASVDEFGRRTEIKNDGRLYNTDSIDFLGKFLLGSQYAKEEDIEFDVLDSNMDDRNGYDIESIEIGDVIQVCDPGHQVNYSYWDDAIWDVDYWDYNKKDFFAQPVIVKQKTYSGHYCTIKASKSVAGVGFRLEDVRRNLENYLKRQADIQPSASEDVYFTYDADGNLVGTTE